jgi:hypothetical protein
MAHFNTLCPFRSDVMVAQVSGRRTEVEREGGVRVLSDNGREFQWSKGA